MKPYRDENGRFAKRPEPYRDENGRFAKRPEPESKKAPKKKPPPKGPKLGKIRRTLRGLPPDALVSPVAKNGASGGQMGYALPPKDFEDMLDDWADRYADNIFEWLGGIKIHYQ